MDLTTKSAAEYFLLVAALPDTGMQKIGVLLLDVDSHRLHCRFRRDYEEFAGAEADWFRELPGSILEKETELGAHTCIEWLEDTLSNALRMSAREPIFIEHSCRNRA